jgi:stachydrine N-demethylase
MNRIDLLNLLNLRRAWYSLPQPFYGDSDLHKADLDLIWSRSWIFIASSMELPKAETVLTAQIGRAAIVLARAKDGIVRAFHNSCRHRGSRLCSARKATAPKLVCPYHQWTYELNGKLLWARDMGPDFKARDHGLRPIHCREIQGMIYVCLAERPADLSGLEVQASRYLAPHDPANLKVAFQSRIIESANWKLVLENNRECYHCAGNHPGLCVTFPDDLNLVGADDSTTSNIGLAHVGRCEAAGLPAKYVIAPNDQWRFVRIPFIGSAVSYTIDGQAAVKRKLDAVPFADAGSCLYFHYPNTWSHYLSDHVLNFRVLPIGSRDTEVTTTWLVHKDAVESVDYDLRRLTEVWLATNEEDRRIVEENQKGVDSPGYVPGPYSPVQLAAPKSSGPCSHGRRVAT